MDIQEIIAEKVKESIQETYKATLDSIELQATNKEFEGDLTVVIFPMLRHIKANPESIGKIIGDYLLENLDEVVRYNVIKGFLNLVIADAHYLRFFSNIKDDKNYGITPGAGKKAILVEYSSPNTNKPLHLGHIRNNLLGWSVSEILKASGKKVYKTQIINDRGIHICKSMLAYRKFGKGETPDFAGLKGDKLVGNYYVKFDEAYRAEVQEMIAAGATKEEAEKRSVLLQEARDMLRLWEAGDENVRALWKKMNGWVYDGFNKTYKNLGVDFDILYYESSTYLLGKEFVEEGLAKGVFYKKDDNSVWIDLTADHYSYNLRRMGSERYFSIKFDLKTPVKAPEAPWGWRD